MKKLFSVLFLVISFFSFSQEQQAGMPVFKLYQDTIQQICKKLYRAKVDKEKEAFNKQLLETFERALNIPNSFDCPLDSLKDIAVLNSPDKKFRIINWHIPKTDGTQEYYGFIQEKFLAFKKKGLFRKEYTEVIQLYPLIDKSSEIKNPENTITDNKKWFGMLYYKIILKKTKSKTYYTLLAWDGNDNYTRKKIIDVLTFDQNGVPHFGADIFNMQKKYPKRVIFEYSSTCTMSLRFNDKKDSIVFDHLAPNEPQLEGQFQYYCGDMSFDGFGFKKGKWNYGMDVDARNDLDKKDKLYKDPHNIGTTHDSQAIIPESKKKKEKKRK